MQNASKADKEQALQKLYRYVNTGQKISVKRYQRLSLWLEGYTYEEIAAAEKVSRQAVMFSVKRDMQIINKFESL
jgi:predicted DNA-binding protein YlxM (UPF0122 family)